jgi:hypothetical protein
MRTAVNPDWYGSLQEKSLHEEKSRGQNLKFGIEKRETLKSLSERMAPKTI